MIDAIKKDSCKTTLELEIEKLEILGKSLGINASEIIHIIKTREFKEDIKKS